LVAVALIWKREKPMVEAMRETKDESPASSSSTREEHRCPARRRGRPANGLSSSSVVSVRALTPARDSSHASEA